MEHQDWNNIIIHTKQKVKNKPTKSKSSENKGTIKSDINQGETKIVAPLNLCTLISQARTIQNKTRKILANELKISEQLLSRWETNKEIPTNKDIANIEKILKIKLPRTKKIKQDL